jgi:hypothetical protein
VIFKNRGRIVAGLLALACFAERDAHADGFDARIFRPSSEANGIGTIDGARAPDFGVVAPSIASDLSVAPVTVDEGAQRNSVIDARWVVEPELAIGAGSSFGLFARVPVITGDAGRDANGAALPASGILPPALGMIVPILRNPLNDGRLVLRAEVAAPVGSMEEFRSDGQITARGSLNYGGYWHRAFALAFAGGQLAPMRGVGDAQLGRSINGGASLRYPLTESLALFGSGEARFDVDFTEQASGLISLGVQATSGHNVFRLLGGLGIRDVIGTPRAMISLAWSFDMSRPPTFMDPKPMEQIPEPQTSTQSAAAATGLRAPL